MQEIGKKIIRLTSVDSTNNYAAKLLKEGELVHGSVILADEQHAGRGQRMTQWQSEPGLNLTSSIVLLEPTLRIEDQFSLTMAVSLALVDLLNEFEIDAQIKWPNDILVQQRKMCGILIENGVRNEFIQSSIIGIGLNVNQRNFNELEATSVANETGIKRPIEEVLFQLIRQLNLRLKSLNSSSALKADYLQKLFGFETELDFEDALGNLFSGKIVGVENSGKLQVQIDKELKSFEMKELKFVFRNDA
jgi:BirA family biotin operon repressor/biotin-[acetyl-CoA-carboxylase] ligase